MTLQIWSRRFKTCKDHLHAITAFSCFSVLILQRCVQHSFHSRIESSSRMIFADGLHRIRPRTRRSGHGRCARLTDDLAATPGRWELNAGLEARYKVRHVPAQRD
jgi:hypothetical protein